MARNLRDALQRNRLAAQELERALRECLGDLRAREAGMGEARLRVIEGGRPASPDQGARPAAARHRPG